MNFFGGSTTKASRKARTTNHIKTTTCSNARVNQQTTAYRDLRGMDGWWVGGKPNFPLGSSSITI